MFPKSKMSLKVKTSRQMRRRFLTPLGEENFRKCSKSVNTVRVYMFSQKGIILRNIFNTLHVLPPQSYKLSLKIFQLNSIHDRLSKKISLLSHRFCFFSFREHDVSARCNPTKFPFHAHYENSLQILVLWKLKELCFLSTLYLIV